MEKLITIIIPTYNMEKYLDRCLTSLIVPNKYMALLEVLIINDGSKDQSSIIAHHYQNKYPQTLRVIDKENGNYGSCVNRGLKEATGKYVKILDADDYFDTQSFIELINHLKTTSVDLILSDFSIVFLNKKEPSYRQLHIEPNRILSFQDVYKELVGIQMHAITYRTEILRNMGYFQSEGISYTDTEWALLPMIYVNTIFYLNRSIYQYVIGREGQTMDKKIYISRRAQIFRINSRLLHEYNQCKAHLSIEKETFFHDYFMAFYRRWYISCLIDEKYPQNELAALDKELKESYPDLWHELNNEQFGSMHYIKQWRNSGYHKKLIYKFMIRIRKTKRLLYKSF